MDTKNTHQSNTLENGKNQKTPVTPIVSRGILHHTEARTVGVLENQKNKDIVRYAFNFESAVSVNDDAFISEHLGDNAIKIRITCIRHGMSLEEEEHERIATISGIKRLISQTRGTALCEGAKKQYKETIVLELQKLGINSKNTYLFSCGETEDGAMVRVQESANILQEDLGIDENHVIGNIVGLDSTDKEDDSEPRRAARTKLHNIDFAHQLINSIKDHSIRNINILCVIHKSNIIGLGEGFLGYNITTHLSTINELKTGGIITIDIDNSGKPVNNHGNYGTLKLDNTSYGEIIAILQGEVGLQDIFTRFKNKKLQIWEVQNYVNAYFKSKRELLFEKYITSTNQDLRVFCIVNLLSDKNEIEKLKIITNYFKGVQNITKEEENILLNNINIFCIKESYIDLCNRKIIKNPIHDENIKSLSKLLEIQSRSLDKKIKFQEGNGILERNIFRIKEEMDQNSNENSFSSIDTDIKWILSSEHKIFTLPAHVGYGKSIWISDIAKQIITDFPHIEVHFFEGKDFNNQYGGDTITQLLKVKLSKTDNQKLILIDAIDEIDDHEIKKTILELISNSVNTVIVTGRLSDFDESKNNGYVTLGLRKISKEKFINSKIDDQKTRDEILNFLEKSRLSLEIETNPLLLNFVCLLSNLDTRDKDLYEKMGIKKLSDIENKSDLYENITKLIIYEHFRSKGKSSAREELGGAINNLCEYAYKLFKGESLSISDEYLNKLSIIFKKSETGEYQFIHHSFYEFFLAKYLSQAPNGNEEIYTVRDEKAGEKNWSIWKKFKPTVLFYAELLMNEANNKANIDRISDLLSEKGLRKNDDIFGEGFFMCLHIIHHGTGYATKKCNQLHCTINTITSEDTTINKFAIIDALYDILITYADYRRIFGEYTNKYVTEIYTWSNKDLINKSFLFQDFQKSIGYEKNEFGGYFTDKIIHSTLSKSSKNYEFIKHRYYHRMIINMGIDNPDVYNESFKKSWENEKLNRGFPKIQNNAELNYFYGMKIINDLFCVWEHAEWLQYNSAGNYFLLAAKDGYRDSIDRLFLCTDELIKEPSNTILVLSWLIELGNDIAINKILEYIKNEKLEIKKWYFKSKVESLSELFIFSKNPEAILFIKSVFLQLLKSDKENENTLLKLYGIFIEAGEQKYIQDIQLPENLIKTYESLNKKKVISTDTDFFTEIYDNFYVLLKNKDFLKALGSIYTLRIYKKISTDEIAEMLNKLENESTEYFEQKPEDEKLYWNFKEELEEELHISGIIPFNSNNVFNKKGEYSYYQFIKEFINSNNKII